MNRTRKLLALVWLLTSSPLLLAAGPADSLGHPIVGTWSWVVFGGSCTETWQFRANNTVLATSGEEVSEKRYGIPATPDARGFYKLVETVTRHNDKKDCSGSLSAGSGEQSTRFIQFSPQGDKMLVCEAAALTACFGPLRRLP